MQISADGHIAAAYLTNILFVMDLTTGAVRLSKVYDYTSSVICMSYDGTYLASGMYTFQWNNQTYDIINDWGKLSLYSMYACSFSDNDIMGVGWNFWNGKQIAVSFYQIDNSQLVQLWNYTFPEDSGFLT